MTPSEYRALGVTEVSGWWVTAGPVRLWFDTATLDQIPERERLNFLTEYLRSKRADGLQVPVNAYSAARGLRLVLTPVSDERPERTDP